MKLLHTEYDLNITFKENQIHILSIENPKVYSRILNDLWSQSHGGEGDFVLSEGEKIKNIGKEIECIFNPFALDCNDKKIIGKLYQELNEQEVYLLFE